jgi:thiol-disulfide isomerase/thioredoxin
MHLVLNSEKDVTLANIKKLEKSLKEPTVLLNRADFCGHCHAFMPEFIKFKEMTKSDKINIVEIESAAQHSIKDKHPSLFKKIIRSDGQIYYPMILLYCLKKIEYTGPRTAESLKEQWESLTGKLKVKKDKIKTKAVKKIKALKDK